MFKKNRDEKKKISETTTQVNIYPIRLNSSNDHNLQVCLFPVFLVPCYRSALGYWMPQSFQKGVTVWFHRQLPESDWKYQKQIQPSCTFLVGGFSPTHLKTMNVKLGSSSPRFRGENSKKYLSCHQPVLKYLDLSKPKVEVVSHCKDLY